MLLLALNTCLSLLGFIAVLLTAVGLIWLARLA